MGRRGVNPKLWFYGFNERLAERPERSARILCGPAAERWLTAEMYGYLAEKLPDDLTCYGEDGTTDLTIYDVAETDGVRTGAWERGRIASIEVKLVYRWYSESRVDDYVTTLCSQVLANRTRGSEMNVGYVFGVFAHWPSRTPRVRGEFSDFRSTVSQRIRKVCDAAGVPCAKPALETVIEPVEVKIGGVTLPFGLVAQYVLPRVVDDE
jgi:hypothetical protein